MTIVLWAAVLMIGCKHNDDRVMIQMTHRGGVFEVPCKINGLEMPFIFDTGASNVCISTTEADFLYKHNRLDDSDFVGFSSAMIANGDVVQNAVIMLRSVEIGGIVLHDVEASVDFNENAPLLFGQSALSQFGCFTIEGDKLYITPKSEETPSRISQFLKDLWDDLWPALKGFFDKLFDWMVLWILLCMLLLALPFVYLHLIKPDDPISALMKTRIDSLERVEGMPKEVEDMRKEIIDGLRKTLYEMQLNAIGAFYHTKEYEQVIKEHPVLSRLSSWRIIIYGGLLLICLAAIGVAASWGGIQVMVLILVVLPVFVYIYALSEGIMQHHISVAQYYFILFLGLETLRVYLSKRLPAYEALLAKYGIRRQDTAK